MIGSTVWWFLVGCFSTHGAPLCPAICKVGARAPVPHGVGAIGGGPCSGKNVGPTHRIKTKGLMTVYNWLVHSGHLPTKWSHVYHRSGVDQVKLAS